MASTMSRPTTHPPGTRNGDIPANGSLNGSVSDGVSDTPSEIELTVVLPDGRTSHITVDYGKQMMDLTVLVAASNKLSPTSYTLHAFNEETGRPIQYHASQAIGTLGITQVQLVSKKSEKKASSQPKPIQPFEVTQRLTVNLPRNQKFVTRVNYKDSLADIFRMICREKNLDPYKYELRHPTHPDEALNMATSLGNYGINEIFVVSVSAQDVRKAVDLPTYDTTDNRVRSQPPAAAVPAAATMPRRKNESDSTGSYMPGMTDKKKKKGILGLFGRRKEGKFKLEGATYGDPSGASSGSGMISTSSMSRSVSTSLTAQPTHAGGASTMPRSKSSHMGGTTSDHGAIGGATAAPIKPPQPNKPPRTKRKAPAPPPPPGAAKPTTELTVAVNQQTHHSRNSSHSSGFDEANMSALESPGNSSRESTKTQESAKTKTSIDASSIDSSEMVHKSPVATVKAEIPAPIAEGPATLRRKKRKAPAPPPPPGASVTVTSSHTELTPAIDETQDFPPPPPPEEFASSHEDYGSADGESLSDASDIAPPSGFSGEDDSELVTPAGDTGQPSGGSDGEDEQPPRSPDELQAAMIDELKQVKPAKPNLNEGLEDVADLMDDALKDDQGAGSDSDSVSSSLIDKVIQDGESESEVSGVNNVNVTDEMALPDKTEPMLISHKLSESEPSGYGIKSDDHVTTISVGMEIEKERHESIERARNASLDDPRLSLRMDEEITFGHEEVIYVEPEQPRSRTTSSSNDDSAVRRKSSHGSDGMGSQIGDETVFTEEDIKRLENDYRLPKLNKEEVVEFKFGTLNRANGNLVQKEEPKKEEQQPVTSLRSLRQAYRRPGNYRSPNVEPVHHHLETPHSFVYTGSRFDDPAPFIPEPEPESPKKEKHVPYDTIALKHHQPDDDLSHKHKEDYSRILRPKADQTDSVVGSAHRSTSFVQSALLRERSSGLSSTQPTKRTSRTSIYDIIKADISQRQGAIHSNPDADSSSVPPQTSDEHEMDYLDYEKKSNRLSGTGSVQQEVVLPKQQFFFSSTSIPDTPEGQRAEKEEEQKSRRTSQLLLGPRPWGASRAVSDPNVKDVEHAVSQHNDKTDQNSNYTDSYSHSRSLHTIPQSPYTSQQENIPRVEISGAKESYYTPVRTLSSEQRRSDLGFSPRGESESDSILEEKSISLIALPTVKKQSYSVREDGAVASQKRHSSGDNNDTIFSSDTASTSPTQSNVNKSTSDLDREAINERYENSKKSLQNQYDQLQHQFTKWQTQLAENQQLLNRKKILPLSSSTGKTQHTVETSSDGNQEENKSSDITSSNISRFDPSPPTVSGLSSHSFASLHAEQVLPHNALHSQTRLSSGSSDVFLSNGSLNASRSLGETGYEQIRNTSLSDRLSSGSRSSSSGSPLYAKADVSHSIGGKHEYSSSGTNGIGMYGKSLSQRPISSNIVSVEVVPKIQRPPSGRRSSSELVRQPMHGSSKKYSSQSSNESTGPPNKPSTSDLLSAKSKLRKGSSEYATPISEGIIEADLPPKLPTSSPPQNKNLGNVVYTDTPKEGSPGSSPASSGRLSNRYSKTEPTSPIHSTFPKPPPPPTAQPVKSAMKGSRKVTPKNDPRFGPKLDPREELMLAIKKAGGRASLSSSGE